jgi:peptide/nickel transport system permease protein
VTVFRRFRRYPSALLALAILALIFLGIIFIPIFSPFDPNSLSPLAANATPGTVDPFTGNTFWLGADGLGRDYLIRIFLGGRATLLLALTATAVTVFIGTVLGLVAGYFGGITDTVLMRSTDFILALPILPMYIFGYRVLTSALERDRFLQETQGGITLTLAIFAIFGWMGISRLVRGQMLVLKSHNFVEASKALGAGSRHVIWRHLLPNSLAVILVATTIQLADFIIWESIMSYLVQGVFDPPVPSWGNMIVNNITQINNLVNLNPFSDFRPWLFLLPTIMVFVTVLCLNYVADTLLEVLNPRTAAA